MTCWQNGKLTKWQVDKMTQYKNISANVCLSLDMRFGHNNLGNCLDKLDLKKSYLFQKKI